MKKKSVILSGIVIAVIISVIAISCSKEGSKTGADMASCGTCNWYGTNYPVCCNAATDWGWENNASCITATNCTSNGQSCSGCGSSTTGSWFKISGTSLLDANGKTFVMKGMAIPLAWFISDVNNNIGNIKSKTNANTMRIVIGTGTSDANWQTCVQNCINNKVIPEVELHDVTCSTDANALNNMAKWWVSKASYLKGKSKYILINLANEWGDWGIANSNQVAWSNAYKAAITTMRNAGLNGTLVIDAPDCGQDIRNGETLRNYAKGLQSYDPQHNLLFTVHLYGEWASGGGSQITSGLAQIKNAGIPVIVGEFSASVNYSSVVSTCNSIGIGFMAWSWKGNSDPTLDMSNDWAGTSLKSWGSSVINNSGGIKSASQCSVF